MRILLVFIGLVCGMAISAQTPVDSLLRLCEKAEDIQKSSLYLQLSKITTQDSALSHAYNKKAFQWAVATNQLPEQAKSVYQSGKIKFNARDFTNAIPYYEKALEMYRQLNDTVGMTTCYRYIGISNFNMSKSEAAIISYLEGLKLAKKDLDYTAEQLANIGLVHNEMNNVNEAISYFRKALIINQGIRDTGSMAVDYDHLGATYSRMKMPDSSLINYNKALYFFKKIRKDDRYAVSLSNMAWILPNYPDSLDKAISYFNKAWGKFQELGWVHYEANIQFGIANVLGKQGKLQESISAYKKSIQLAKKHKRELFLMKQLYQGLSEVYQKKGDYQLALENHIISSHYNDSITEKQKSDQIADLEKQYETEKKENEIIRLTARQELTNIQLSKNKQIKQLAIITASLLLIIVLFILLKYFDKIKTNEVLEQKNQQIAKSENELRLLNASKNKFFSIIAHDLKNPLHTVMGYSYLLSKDYDRFTEEERRRFALDIHHSTNNIFRLLQNLLEWSRAQTGALKCTPTHVALNKVLQNSTSVLHSMAEQKRICLKLSFTEDHTIYADPLMIETVLRNLITNAIKFTPEDGLVEVLSEKTGSHIQVSVNDTGIGISEEDIKIVFRIDSKVKRRGTNNEDGSGLGLILCQEFVDKNHGTIWVESTPGKGSSFKFTIPAVAKG